MQRLAVKCWPVSLTYCSLGSDPTVEQIMIKAVQQKPSPVDGIKYSRWAVVRNSYPMLKTTTIKTWLDLFPEATFGNLLWTPPITHHIRLPARGDAAGIDCEIIFLALDQPKDVRKLLSLELTGAWVNEARELPKAVIDGLTHRVGRYPTKRDGGATWHGIIMDTNPMDDDHWWHRVAEKEPITGKYAWKFFKQPGGVIEVAKEDLPENPEANDHIFASGKWWRLNEKAENVNNLPAGYYMQQLAGKNLDWIRCYAQGVYTFVKDGQSVWPEYDDNISQDEDGDQIYGILSSVLLGTWNDVPAASQWATYDATETWANAVNLGLGDIDQPGLYTMTAQSTTVDTIYNIVSDIANSAFGYIYEANNGNIGYADADHRQNYLLTNGYVELDAGHALGNGLSESRS